MSPVLLDKRAARGATIEPASAGADSRWRMISRTGEYALRVALHLGRLEAGVRINAHDAAATLDVPAKYMARVLNALAHAGVVTSARGSHGGFQLAVPADELTLAEVVAPFDAVGDAPQCLLRNQLCDHDEPCFAHEEWQHVAGHVRDFFRNTSIADLLDPARQAATGAGLPSPEETMTTITKSDVAEMTVNEVIRLEPKTLALFKRYGVDSCCGGAARVRDAAVRHGADTDTLLQELHAIIEAPR